MAPHTCKICGLPLSVAFTSTVLGRHAATYQVCEACGLLSAQDPFWLEEANSSAIASTDTGLVLRNIAIADRLAVILYFLMGDRGRGRYVDVAGGYGMLTRLMRDYGFDFYWSDRSCQNLLAHGYDYFQDLGPCRAVTAFEVLEHTTDPAGFIQMALHYGQADTIIFTTELYASGPPPPQQWWYYSFETGQHVSFFQRRTLETLAKKLGLCFSSNGWVHVYSKNMMSETLLKVITGKLRITAIRWLRKRLASRTMSDHVSLVEKLKRSQT